MRGGGGPGADGQRGGPAEAVVMGRVYRLGDNSEAIGIPVRLGVSDGAFTEVLSGLPDDAVLIIGGGPGGGRGAAGGPGGFRFGF